MSDEIELNLKQYNELGDPKVGPFAWIVAFSLLYGFFAVLRLGNSATVGLRYARLQQQFTNAATEKSDMERLIDSSQFRPLFASHEKLITAARPLFGMIRQGELSRCFETLNRVDAPKHPILYVLAGRLRAIADDDRKYQELRQSERFYQGTEAQIRVRYDDLRVQAANILGARKDPFDQTRFDFYSEGVLAGIPRMLGVPDGAENLSDLQPALAFLAERTPQELEVLQTKLRSLGSLGEMMREQIEQRSERARSRSSEITAVSERRRKAHREARFLLRRFATELTKQSLSTDIRYNYESLRSISSRYQVFLPELQLEERNDALSEEELSHSLDSELGRLGL